MVSFKRPLALGERNVVLSTSKSFSLLKGTQTVNLFTMKPSARFPFIVRHVLRIEVSFISLNTQELWNAMWFWTVSNKKNFHSRVDLSKNVLLNAVKRNISQMKS